ncbi:GNAT family N-acetyltransferase [Rhodoplanes sp. TEM]|uniref:GNAT family N-acetyltransferase n=1 Tax=Rhodoplanes TaxID=29407 RepID=UPI0023505E87|nr:MULTISPECIES: GNAT family N-acetyltransferase [Rhodoplanes]MDC7986686.1 GNAT family N-acetyltransferase [Rhodoplanes sp. TEM]
MPLADLAARRDAWAALAAGAIVPNVFYAPAFALAATPLHGRGVGAIVIRDAEDRLVGLFPMRLSRTRWGVPLPLMVGWTHPFAPLGTPLLDPGDPAGVVGAAVDHLARAHPGVPLLLPCCPADGPVAAALDAAIARRGGRQAAFGVHARAELRSPSGPDAPPAILDPRAKEHARQRRRLAERGAPTFDLARGPAAREALADFFALEAQGWKGRAGTAAASRPAELAMMTEAVTGLAETPGAGALVARLRLDGRPIAAGVVLTSGRAAWFWKTAYDETLAKFSPGVLLTLDLSAALLREPDIDVVDSCAVENHPMIDRLWPGRRALSDRLIGQSTGPGFALACRLETLRRRLITTARQARDRLRGR